MELGVLDQGFRLPGLRVQGLSFQVQGVGVRVWVLEFGLNLLFVAGLTAGVVEYAIILFTASLCKIVRVKH